MSLRHRFFQLSLGGLIGVGAIILFILNGYLFYGITNRALDAINAKLQNRSTRDLSKIYSDFSLDFETPGDLAIFAPQDSGVELSSNFSTSGKKSLLVEFSPSTEYPAIILELKGLRYLDWSKLQEFSFDAFNTLSKDGDLYIQIRSGERENMRQFKKKFLLPAKKMVKISLLQNELQEELDLSRISHIAIFMARVTTTYKVYFDNMKAAMKEEGMFDLYGGANIAFGPMKLSLTLSALRKLIVLADIFLLAAAIVMIFSAPKIKIKFLRISTYALSVCFFCLVIIQVLVYVDMAYIEPNWIKVEMVNLKIPRLGKLAKGLKIVQFSDLHTMDFGAREKRLVKIINALQPDIILFTGGFTGEDFKNIRAAINSAACVFDQLKPKIGIWAVTDDSDDFLFKNNLFKQKISEAGVNLLFNQSKKIFVRPDAYFWLVGVEDAFYGKNGINEALANVPSAEPKLLITHSPNLIDSAADAGVDLMLVGKTHGGQIGISALRKLVGYITQFNYISGLYKVKETYMYVNRGIGVKTSRYRFFCRPEVTVFNITD
jgi:hypothetical protein